MKQTSQMTPFPTPEYEFSQSMEALAVVKPSAFYDVLKRGLDILLALVALVVLLPVFVVIAVCIKLDDHGSVFHWREIVGFQGRSFRALKFRTMIPDADVYLQQRPELKESYLRNMKLDHDPRVTRIGRWLRKTSLDELPQLLNILCGQMSLVGPRIIHPSELPRYGVYAYKRLSVKPGLTGLWQVSGRQNSSYDERVVLDMYYVDHRSILFDLQILLQTLKVFVIHTGI